VPQACGPATIRGTREEVSSPNYANTSGEKMSIVMSQGTRLPRIPRRSIQAVATGGTKLETWEGGNERMLSRC
jgi:hypothetical protein